MKPDKPYFHKLTDTEYEEIKQKKLDFKQIVKNYAQPDWCKLPEALDYLGGCWSLLMDRGKISQEFCKDCEFCKL